MPQPSPNRSVFSSSGRRTPAVALLLAVLAMVASSCAIDAAGLAVDGPGAAAGERLTESGDVDTDALVAGDRDSACGAGLTEAGFDLLAGSRGLSTTFPAYDLDVDIEPSNGSVTGTLQASIPADDDEMKFRVFAGMEAFEANLSITDVTVDGEPVDYELDEALLSVDNPSGIGTVDVELAFDYQVNQLAANESLFGALSGETLQPDQVGLLGRTDSGMQMGHWFPVWLPNGTRTDADPSGFGDIGAFPAAEICARVTVPAGYDVITGGVNFGRTGSTVVEGGLGLRDFAMLISNDVEMVKGQVDGVTINVWGPTGDRESLQTVLDYSLRSQQALVDAFGPYPWQELEVVSAPLGGGVGGMEWPGMVWIERTMFAGGLPGMGDLGGFGALFEDMDLDSMLGQIGGPAIGTVLEWTVAHELGHEWWHAVVGNDSIESPAVDEPLAQHAACVAMQSLYPDNWRAICESQTIGQYAQARGLGVDDAPASRPSDEFSNSLQYGAVIYGKAPGFYLEVADLIGWDTLNDALADFVEQNAFTLVSTDALRSHLVDAAGSDGPTVDALWDRWFEQALGDEDIEPASPFGDLDFGGLFGGGDGTAPDLDELFGEDSPFGSLFGGEGGELDLDELFGPDSPFGSGLDGESPLGDLDLEEFFGALEEGDPEALDGLFNELLEDMLGGN